MVLWDLVGCVSVPSLGLLGVCKAYSINLSYMGDLYPADPPVGVVVFLKTSMGYVGEVWWGDYQEGEDIEGGLFYGRGCLYKSLFYKIISRGRV